MAIWIFVIPKDKVENFKNSKKFNEWAIKISEKSSNAKSFNNKVRKGDILYFVCKGEYKKSIIASCIYISHEERNIGPLVSIDRTNEELGYVEGKKDWNYKIIYTKLEEYEYDRFTISLKNGRKFGQAPIRKFDSKKHQILPN